MTELSASAIGGVTGSLIIVIILVIIIVGVVLTTLNNKKKTDAPKTEPAKKAETAPKKVQKGKKRVKK